MYVDISIICGISEDDLIICSSRVCLLPMADVGDLAAIYTVLWITIELV